MFTTINRAYEAAKRRAKGNQFIIESVLGIEEVLPGSEEEIEDAIDVDSVPDDVYKTIDAALDKIINDPKYDDTEVEELIDDDFDEDEVSDDVLNAVIDEACSAWM